jgi:TolB-like protein/DNA-binding SARP family transcriptional activator/Tfp pilus assembly protein PilF
VLKEPPTLSIATLGKLTVRYKDRALVIAGRKARALIGYLAVSETHEATRERLVGLLWSEVDESNARASLRQTLREIRLAFEEAGVDALKTDKLTVALNRALVRVDLSDVFESARDGRVHPRLLEVDRAFEHLLDEFDSIDAAFRAWLLTKRQSLQDRILQHLEPALSAEAGHRRSEVARAILNLDPTHEGAARALIRIKAQAGDIGGALGVYKGLWDLLGDEYDVEPSKETQELIAALKLAQPETKPGSSPPALLPAEVADFSVEEVESGYDARPSIAVLPFRKLATGEDTYFADGIVDNVIHALAGLKELFVIARGSTLAFGGGPIDVQAIGSALGVRYLLYGSVQRAETRLRIATELIDTETAEVIRASNYDGDLSDLFGLQDRIAEEVVTTIAPQVRQHELRRALRKHPQSMTAYDLVLQALDLLFRMDYASFSRARGYLQRAMLIDPTYAPAFSYAACWHMARVGQEWSPSLDADIREAARLSEAAIACDGHDPIALGIYGYVQSYLKKHFDEAFAFFDRAIARSPNCPFPWTFRGATLCFIGDGPGAVASASQGVRLSPLDPHVHLAQHILAQAHYTNGDYHEAVQWARRSDRHNRHLSSNLRTLIASLVAIGNTAEAREVAERHQKILPTFRVSEWAARTPMQGEMRAGRVERLLAAGLPK